MENEGHFEDPVECGAQPVAEGHFPDLRQAFIAGDDGVKIICPAVQIIDQSEQLEHLPIGGLELVEVVQNYEGLELWQLYRAWSVFRRGHHIVEPVLYRQEAGFSGGMLFHKFPAQVTRQGGFSRSLAPVGENPFS